jgi:hypothetical protein
LFVIVPVSHVALHMPIPLACWAFFRITDLRFADAAKERAYKKSLQKRLVKSFMLVAALLIAGSLVHDVGEMFSEMSRADDKFVFGWKDIRTHKLVVNIVGRVLLSLCTIVLGMLWSSLDCVQPFNWEIAITSVFVFYSIAPSWVNGWTMAVLYDRDPLDNIWQGDNRSSEGGNALVLDTCTTVLCLFLPIRMILKWIPPTLGCISFGISSLAVSSPFPAQAPSNVVCLISLTFCALWGAWHLERNSRKNWIAQERVARKSLELEQQHSEVYRILDRLCDGLVHLRQDYTILDQQPARLAALLLSHRAESLSNSNFCDYLASDGDRMNFTSALQEADASGGMVHVSLRDASGHDFKVYAYHTRT